MKNLSVRILVTVPKPEHFEACTLCFDTLRVGFPTANIRVTANPIGALEWSGACLGALYDKVEAAGAQLERPLHPIHHAKWIKEEVDRATGPLVLLDADTIFWKSCEDWDFGPETLLAGYYVPRIWNDFARCISMPKSFPRMTGARPIWQNE